MTERQHSLLIPVPYRDLSFNFYLEKLAGIAWERNIRKLYWYGCECLKKLCPDDDTYHGYRMQFHS